ncbi:acyl carrier protein [Catellatospora sp. TT07R-123]|uniref:acyl carrier protein n=1 Tax=Catellatospora sp. TT07R-123 TaxID=2733863 RepID=UPI001BB39685|nr:acyl carrier protein [Catellatospora sp. TT07R-123]
MTELQAVLARDVDSLRGLTVEQFAASPLRELGVDSLALTSLAVFVSSRFALEIPDDFLFSDDVERAEGWTRMIHSQKDGVVI